MNPPPDTQHAAPGELPRPGDLAQFSQALAVAGLDRATVAQVAADLAARLVGDLCTVRLLSDDGATLDLAGYGDVDPELMRATLAALEPVRSIPMHERADSGPARPTVVGDGIADGDEPFREVVRSGRTLVVGPDSIGDLYDRLGPGHGTFRSTVRPRHIVFMPLMARGRAVGCFAFARRLGGDAYTPEDMAVLHDVADRTALAVDNARLHEELVAKTEALEAARRDLEERAQRQLWVADVAGRLAESAFDADEVLRILARELATYFGDVAVVRLLGADGDSLELAAYDTRDPERREEVGEVLQSARVRRGAWPMGAPADTGLPVLVPVVDPSAREQMPGALRMIVDGVGVQSIVSVPLRSRDMEIGVIVMLRSSASPPFTPDDTALLADLAVRVGVTVENARLLVRSEAEIAERTRTEAKLAHQATHDSLTGLPNRRHFHAKLDSALDRARTTGTVLSVLFMDLDRFKVVNDSLGHDIGDQLLVAVSKRLSRLFPSGSTFARLGGDEFAVLLEDLDDETGAVEVARSIIDSFALPFAVEGPELYAGTSVGIACTTGGADRPNELLRQADAAMYRAKRRGRNAFDMFDEALRSDIEANLDTENALHRALQRNEFQVHYQPMVELESGRLIGFEALLRWERPGMGVVPAMEFVHLLEDTGLISVVGDWVLGEVCRRIRLWETMFGDAVAPLVVHVNVSAKQLSHPDVVERVQRVLQANGVAASHLCLELTETAVMEDPAESLRRLRGLAELGVHLAIDDFGTGMSSLSYLRRFPIEVLKIDKEFVNGLGVEDEDAAIASAIMSLAATLGLQVIAEGVETDVQRAELVRIGCLQGQGWLFGRPIPYDTVTAMLRETMPVIGDAADDGPADGAANGLADGVAEFR